MAAGLQAWRVRRVTEHIEQNIDKPLPQTELAAVDSPLRFVIRQRIARACEFLARSALSIAEISRRVGFRRGAADDGGANSCACGAGGCDGLGTERSDGAAAGVDVGY